MPIIPLMSSIGLLSVTKVREEKRGSVDKVIYSWNTLAKDFVSRCLTIDPAKRMTAREALEHPWLTAEHTQPTSPVDEARDLLPNVRGNFNARRTFKRAVDMVRLSYHLGHKHVPSMNPGDSSVGDVKPVNEGIDEVLMKDDD